MKIQLPQCTLICLTSLDFEGHKEAVDKSCEGIEFGGVKIVWDENIKSIDDWNKAIVYDLWKYIDTDYCILIHADGYVIHPEVWDDSWLKYDYIGAPWPLPRDNYSYRDINGKIQRVGNSVSLRSRRLLKFATERNLEWRPFYGNTNEDGFISVHHRHEYEQAGMTFAPLEVAKFFSKEHEIEENKGITTFAFHQV